MTEVSKSSLYVVVEQPLFVQKASIHIPLSLPIYVTKVSAYFVIGESVGRILKDLTTNYKIQINKELESDYRTFHAFDKQLTVSYAIDDVFQVDLSSNWQIRAAIFRELTIDFKTIHDPINIDLEIDYAFEAFGKSLEISYAIAFFKNLALDYKIKLSVDLTSSYVVDGEWRVDLESSYKIALNKSLSISYRVVNVIQTLDIDWHIGDVVTSDYYYLERLPETPITEIWQYMTRVTTARNGTEQRMSVRKHPRVVFQHSYIIENDADYRHFREQLMRQSEEDIRVANHACAVMIEPTNFNATTVYCDMSKTDIRVDDYVAFFELGTEASDIRVVTAVDVDNFEIDSGFPFNGRNRAYAMPTRLMRFADGSALSMRTIHGATALNFTDAAARPVVRPSAASGLVSSYDGFPILTQRPLADEDIPEAFGPGFVPVDLVPNLPPEVVRRWATPVVTKSHDFKISRGDFDYWREFADTVRGAWKAFLMPSFRADLVTVEFAGAALKVAGNKLVDQFALEPYKRLMITTNTGVQYRSVTAAVADGDNTQLTLNTAISGASISEISFINLVRLNDDLLTFEHHQLHSILGLNMRVIQQ